jgi:hypothetical protein
MDLQTGRLVIIHLRGYPSFWQKHGFNISKNKKYYLKGGRNHENVLSCLCRIL